MVDNHGNAAPSTDEGQTAYEKGFRIWQSLHTRAAQNNLDLRHTFNYLSARGTSVCKRSHDNDACHLPPLEQHLQIPVSVPRSTCLRLSADLDHSHQKWFRSEENLLVVLVSAWSSTVVDIGRADGDAARWWAAILAPGEGWEAYIDTERARFRAPWSVTLPANQTFTLSHQTEYCSLSDTPVTAATALRLLSVLFLPLLQSRRKEVILPRPKLGPQYKGTSDCSMRSHLGWAGEARHLDKHLEFVFYEPGITSNVVSPWLQSIFSVLKSVDRNRILAHMLMSRLPHLAFLWLGGSILDIHHDVLRDGKFGLIPTEIHAAMWSGTVQSFMQEPIRPAANGYILRSDECRLLYLTQEESHTRWPVCQWAPFGSTALRDAEIEVRLHADCTEDCLQYAGWKWRCRNERVVYQMAESVAPLPTFPLVQPLMPNITIDYEALDHQKNSLSTNASRSIFGWLRVEGFPPSEREIHESVRIDDCDDGYSTDNGSESSYTAKKAAVGDTKLLMPNRCSEVE
ncbi:hypothetical protein BJY00DRAFT_324314 [Aspergillus carlsbadensis]|nr:hypothetical protein BJY00DRAFT_324314 [Aspergillus carlsbadensis]